MLAVSHFELLVKEGEQEQLTFLMSHHISKSLFELIDFFNASLHHIPVLD